MKELTTVFFALISLVVLGKTPEKATRYEGKFCSGSGDVEYLRLIDESFAFFHPNPVVPNLTMIYKPEWDTFTEGAGWGAWWIQNSYGFSYAVTPFLEEPWASNAATILGSVLEQSGRWKAQRVMGRWKTQ